MKIYQDLAGNDETSGRIDALVMLLIGSMIVLMFQLPGVQHGQPYGLLALTVVLIGLGVLAARAGWVRLAPPDFVSVDAAGVFLAKKQSLPAQFRAWDAVAEVVLAKKFKIVYQNGQISCRHVVLIFLKSGAEDTANCAMPGISPSGTSRLYLSADFPDGDWRAFESRLSRFAPKTVAIKVCSSVEFDRKDGVDRYA